MPVSDTTAMIAGMTPVLQPGIFCFASLVEEAILAKALPHTLCSFQEAEGLSVILPVKAASDLGLDVGLPMRQITLNVFSALDGIGLTAAVATRLTEHGISCNVVAATHHDHIFVPAVQAEAALAALQDLQQQAMLSC